MNDIPPSPTDDLYPDITEAGGLRAAVAKIFSEIHPPRSDVKIRGNTALVICDRNGSSCQISMALHTRTFFLDFRRDGILHGTLLAADLPDIADAVDRWLGERPPLAAMMQRFPLFEPSEIGIAHEEGRTVEYQWEELHGRWKRSLEDHPSDGYMHDLVLLIEAARDVPQLRELHPFTSLYQLHFSRVTGYPFTWDAPFAFPLGNGRYRVCSGRYHIVKRTTGPNAEEYDDAVHEILCEGTADEAIAMIVANLPPGYGPAVTGTAEDTGTSAG